VGARSARLHLGRSRIGPSGHEPAVIRVRSGGFGDLAEREAPQPVGPTGSGGGAQAQQGGPRFGRLFLCSWRCRSRRAVGEPRGLTPIPSPHHLTSTIKGGADEGRGGPQTGSPRTEVVRGRRQVLPRGRPERPRREVRLLYAGPALAADRGQRRADHADLSVIVGVLAGYSAAGWTASCRASWTAYGRFPVVLLGVALRHRSVRSAGSRFADLDLRHDRS